MSTSFFDNAYFLQSIGWGIANSFWQAVVLWLLYHAIVQLSKKMTAESRYQLSLSLLFISAAWFCFTTIQNYCLLRITAAGNSQAWSLRLQSATVALPFVALFYCGILIFYVLRFIQHYLQLRYISSNGLTKPPVDIRIFTIEKALHLGIKKTVQVWLTDHIDVPAVTGFIKPIILLPAAICSNLSVEQVNAILLHELAHIKRNDFLLNLIQSLITILLFFNPFIHLLNNIAKKERENCCDDWVLNFRFNPLEYAKALLILEEQRQLQLLLAMAATSNKKMLLQRIRRLMVTPDPGITDSRFQKCRFYGFIVLLFTGLYLFPAFTANKFQHVNLNKMTDVVVGSPIVITKESTEDIAGVMKEYGAVMATDKISTAARSPKITTNKKQVVQKQPTVTGSDDFVEAVVNEDALPDNTKLGHELLTTVSNKEKDSSQSSLLVKIEEEQSGKKQRNTYYFKLKNNNGNTSLKPLLFIKKFKAARLKTDSKLRIHKKRITT